MYDYERKGSNKGAFDSDLVAIRSMGHLQEAAAKARAVDDYAQVYEACAIAMAGVVEMLARAGSPLIEDAKALKARCFRAERLSVQGYGKTATAQDSSDLVNGLHGAMSSVASSIRYAEQALRTAQEAEVFLKKQEVVVRKIAQTVRDLP